MAKENFEFVSDTVDTRSAFERSLDELCVYDIASPEEKKAPGAGAVLFNVFRYGLLVLFLGIFAYCVFAIIHRGASYMRADDIYSDLAQRFESGELGAQAAQSEVPPLISGSAGTPLPCYADRLAGKLPEEEQNVGSGAAGIARVEALKEINPDAVGWLMVDGTNISLPVVQGDDNEYYLNYAFDGSENMAGTLFFDCSNQPKVTNNYNLVIYGHNMEGGQMFSPLTKFLDEDFFDANRTITLYSDEGIFTYEIFAVFKGHESETFFYTYFEGDEEFLDFMYDMKYNSLYVMDGIEFTESDRMLTLSTCTNENQKERYVVQAKLVNHEK